MYTYQEILQQIEDLSGAEMTNRIIEGDENFNFPEWSETGVYKGVPVVVYYRTTPQDQKNVNEASGDWGYVEWNERIESIMIDTVELDNTNLNVEKAEEITGLEAEQCLNIS